jgi:hypothetical protein
MKEKTARTSALIVFLLVTSLFLCTNAAAQTPEQLIKSLVEAVQKGDAEGFRSVLTADSQKALTESLSSQASLRQAQEESIKALDERFGKGTTVLKTPPEGLKPAFGHLAAAEVESQQEMPDGSIELRVKTLFKGKVRQVQSREDIVVARMEEGRKLDMVPRFTADAWIAAQRRAAIERITQEIRTGMFQDRQSAMLAILNAWKGKEAR